MKIHIILNDPYPFGMANSNRIHLYARGLINLGNKVKIIIPKPKFKTKKHNVNKQGIFDGVPYYYHTSPYKSQNFIKRRLDSLLGALNTAFLCVQEKPDIIIVISDYIPHLILFKISSLINRTTIFLEKSEVPLMKQDRILKFQKIYLRWTFSLFDGIISITNQLSKYLVEELGVKSKIIVIPILIDERKVRACHEYNNRKNFILYSGTFSERKDGVLTILKALSDVFKQFPSMKLFVTGNAMKSSDYNNAIKIIEDENITNNVYFTGFISQDELNSLMSVARLLITGKPLNRQNMYNFPTKLGEYLVSGTPVLCTYADTYNSYFVEDCNIYMTDLSKEALSSKIIKILNSPGAAEVVGKRGRVLALEEFGIERQARILNSFFYSILKIK